MGGKRADAALYWKAYALSRAGRRRDALAAIAQLKHGAAEPLAERRPGPRARDPPGLGPAARRRVAVRRGAEADGPQQPDAQRLRAGGADAREVPDRQRLAPSCKKQALFVLSQSGSPRAREIVVRRSPAASATPTAAGRGPQVPRPLRRRGEPAGAGRDLRLHRRRGREEGGAAQLHAVGRQGARAGRRRAARRIPELRDARHPAARRHGRAGPSCGSCTRASRRCGAQEGHPPRPVHRRRRGPARGGAAHRAGSRAAQGRHPQPGR